MQFCDVELKIGIIIPTRDRPEFLKNCLRLIDNQSIKPTAIEIVNDAPLNSDIDITWRYKLGYERLKNKGLDLIAFIEDDDWYSPDYLKFMSDQWLTWGRPDIIGTNFTIYYQIKLKKHFTMFHEQRSSAMNTLIKPDLQFAWCPDNEPYTDLHLWNLATGLKGIVIEPPILSIGIKHGVGSCGGRSHLDRLHRYKNDDNGFLKNIVDADSYKFYTEYADILPDVQFSESDLRYIKYG